MSSTKHALQYFPYNLNSQECWVHIQGQTFSVASTHLYKSSSVCQSVGPLVAPSIKYFFIYRGNRPDMLRKHHAIDSAQLIRSFIHSELARRVTMTARQPEMYSFNVLTFPFPVDRRSRPTNGSNESRQKHTVGPSHNRSRMIFQMRYLSDIFFGQQL